MLFSPFTQITGKHTIVDLAAKNDVENKNCSHIFRLTYKQSFTKNGETIEKSSTVKLKKTTSLPFISVYPSKGMFSPGDDVVFSVNVKGGTYSGNVTYKWTCYDKFGK